MSDDDSSMMIMVLLAACCCSSSSVSLLGGGGAAFALLRSRQAAPAEDAPVAAAEDAPVAAAEDAPAEEAPAEEATVAAAPRTPKPARTIRSGGRAISKAFRKPVRSIPKAFRKPVRKIRKVIRKPVRSVRKVIRKPVRSVRKVIRKPVRSVKRVGRKIKGIFRRRRCFAPETPVKLQNGETVLMKNLKLGDILVNGSVVDAVMTIRNENDPYYKLPGNILVTGSHHVEYDNKYIHVMNLPGATRTEIVDDELSCLVTSDHKIPVGDFTFWDWEDNLIPLK